MLLKDVGYFLCCTTCLAQTHCLHLLPTITTCNVRKCRDIIQIIRTFKCKIFIRGTSKKKKRHLRKAFHKAFPVLRGPRRIYGIGRYKKGDKVLCFWLKVDFALTFLTNFFLRTQIVYTTGFYSNDLLLILGIDSLKLFHLSCN